MEQKIIGQYSNRPYYSSEAIRIVNYLQATLYWLNGVEPLDVYPSRDFETKKPILVFVFNKSETKDVFDLWVKHELV